MYAKLNNNCVRHFASMNLLLYAFLSSLTESTFSVMKIMMLMMILICRSHPLSHYYLNYSLSLSPLLSCNYHGLQTRILNAMLMFCVCVLVAHALCLATAYNIQFINTMEQQWKKSSPSLRKMSIVRCVHNDACVFFFWEKTISHAFGVTIDCIIFCQWIRLL